MSAISEFDQQFATQQTTVSIPVCASSMDVYIVKPVTYGPHPVVVLLMSMYGVGQPLLSTARLLAERGYAVVIPDLYHHLGDNSPYLPVSFDEALDSMHLLAEDRALDDIALVLKFIERRRDLDTAKTVVMGLCMGGKWSLLTGCYFGEKICCVSSYYASGFETCFSDFSHLKVPGQFVIAGKSLFTSERVLGEIESSIGIGNAPVEVLNYENAQHNFLDASDRAFDPVVAADALQKTCHFFSGYAQVAQR